MNSFRHLRSLALVVSAVACCVPVQAQDFKAGFVNTDRIFREANSAKAAQAKLEQEFSRREKDIIELKFDQGHVREIRARCADSFRKSTCFSTEAVG